MTKKRLQHPRQPLVWDGGVIRFKRNAIVDYLVGWSAGHNGHVGYPKIDGPAPDLNQIARMVADGIFSREDHAQLHQLIGYSVSGCPSLRGKAQASADAEAEAMYRRRYRKRPYRKGVKR